MYWLPLFRLMVLTVSLHNHCWFMQVDGADSQLAQPLREYILYTEAIKSVLRRRDAIQMEYEITLEELKRKKTEKTQVKSLYPDYCLTCCNGWIRYVCSWVLSICYSLVIKN